MTDRELLELAAKAAGMNVLPHDMPWPTDADGWFYNAHGNGGGMFSRSLKRSIQERWNPLTDDGDALRLAVKLRMDIFTHTSFGAVHVNWRANKKEGGVSQEKLDDPCATTRRAIVRSAAVIGRGK